VGAAALGLLLVAVGVVAAAHAVALPVSAACAAASVGLLLAAGTIRRKGARRVAKDVRDTCAAERVQKARVVVALFEGGPAGRTCRIAMRAIDRETTRVMRIGKRGEAAVRRHGAAKTGTAGVLPEKIEISVSSSSGSVDSVTIAHEDEADLFRPLALAFLAENAHVEAIAAIAMVGAVYGEIARPAMRGFVEMSYQGSPLKEAVVAAHKVLGEFDFKPEYEFVLEALSQRRTRSVVEMLVATQQGAPGPATLSIYESSMKPVVRHQAFVGACIEYLAHRAYATFPVIRALEALSFIPDARVVPHLLRYFERSLFDPEGISAIIRLGPEVHPQLLEAIARDGVPYHRFNAALAAGAMELEAVKPVLRTLMGRLMDPIERIGCGFALVRLNDSEWLPEMVTALDHENADVRHAAAIALEHLTLPLADEVYGRHLCSGTTLVRLRLTRKLGSQDTSSPALIDALAARLDDEDEAVRTAAVEALGKLGAEKVYDCMAALCQTASSQVQVGAYGVLGKLSDDRALPLLREALSKRKEPSVRRAAITALGDLKDGESIVPICGVLGDDEMRNPAYWALLRIGLEHADAVRQALERRSDAPLRLFVLAALGDGGAKEKMKGIMRPDGDVQQLFEVIQYASILHDPIFEVPLRSLLTFRRPSNFPGDRYISYIAFKALVHILVAKSP
jgi:HEAT repeat protein